MKLKPHLHPRVCRLIKTVERSRVVMPKSEDVGKFIEIEGTVIRAVVLKSLEWERQYICKSCKKE